MDTIFAAPPRLQLQQGLQHAPQAHPPLPNAAVCSSDASLQFEGVHYIRRLLSKEQSPPTEAVLGTGVLPRLVSFLDSSNSRMVFESCWAITNIASTQYTHLVVEAGAVPKLGASCRCCVSPRAASISARPP